MSEKSRSSISEVSIPEVLFGRFLVKECLGKGAFGAVYKIIDKQSLRAFAVKVEKIRESREDKEDKEAKVKQTQTQTKYASQLQIELSVYGKLKGRPVCRGDPSWRWPTVIYFKQDKSNNYMIVDLLGKDLEFLVSRQAKKVIPVASLGYLATRMITLVQSLHEMGFIHRDLKPHNFVMEYAENYKKVKEPKIYLIDFGLSKEYVQNENEHLAFDQNKPLRGTVRFCSVNTHIGTEQTRRDDLQCLGYIFLYMLLGKLPWQELYSRTKSKKEGYHLVMVEKMTLSVETLCAKLPKSIRDGLMAYLFYVNSLKYHDEPDYDYCRSIFRKYETAFNGYL